MSGVFDPSVHIKAITIVGVGGTGAQVARIVGRIVYDMRRSRGHTPQMVLIGLKVAMLLCGQAVRVVGKKGNLQAHEEDVNGDGLVDLVVQIEDEDGTYQEGNTIATLTGETFDGTSIQGEDAICIVSG